MYALTINWVASVTWPRAQTLAVTWRQKAFWRQPHYPLHWTSLACCLVFWLGTIGVFLAQGIAPRPGWLSSAFLSVLVSTWMTWRVYAGMDDPGKRLRPAMLLLAFTAIILLNGALLLLMWVVGAKFEWADWRIIVTASIGVLITFGVTALRGEAYSSGWALFGYATSMKSLPQVWQAWDLLTTPATLNPWVMGSLFLQGTSRWQLSRYAYRVNPTSDSRAQYWNASVDLWTVGMIQAVTILDAVR